MDHLQVFQALARLRAKPDVDAVRSAIVDLSGPSGPVKSYAVSFDTTRRAVSCFLEMKSPMLESEVRELHALGFGNGLYLEFALGRDSAGTT
jgi:hypothetical protein